MYFDLLSSNDQDTNISEHQMDDTFESEAVRIRQLGVEDFELLRNNCLELHKQHNEPGLKLSYVPTHLQLCFKPLFQLWCFQTRVFG